MGLFWDETVKHKKPGVINPMPPIPNTGWLPPTQFPNLSTATRISIDVETYDPELEEHGPGWARGVGCIVGLSVGAEGGGRWYFPMRHTVEPQYNLPAHHVMAWARDTFADPRQPKIGANIMYDVGWLAQEGVTVAGPLIDVQFAEALLDERSKVALELLAQKYLGESKQSSLLYEWCAQYYGGKPNGRQRANIYRSPPRLVGPYAESDADLPLRLLPILEQRLHAEGLAHVFDLENRLINLLIAMRFAGVTVDIDRAEQAREVLLRRSLEAQHTLNTNTGMIINVKASASIAKAFDKLGITYPRTETGKPSFVKEFLESVEHPIGEAIGEIRKLEIIRTTFLENYILGSHVNGKVFCQFHPMRNDGGGARSGRFSSSDPNLQNIPIRDKELGPLLRSCFIPDAGHQQWRKYDESQIEYRFLAHFAVGPGSDDLRNRYNNDPDTDYHVVAGDLIKSAANLVLDRRPIKTINFGLIYGMGEKELARRLALDTATRKTLFNGYHQGLPFAKATMKACSDEALSTGIITTILGRRSRFDLYEPVDNSRNGSNYVEPLPLDLAIRKFEGPIQRAFGHKALNRRLQGSAADLLKAAMVICWESGIFRETGVPRITVHDELGFSDPGGLDAPFKAMHGVMENALKLNVPVRCDFKAGPNWGACE